MRMNLLKIFEKKLNKYDITVRSPQPARLDPRRCFRLTITRKQQPQIERYLLRRETSRLSNGDMVTVVTVTIAVVIVVEVVTVVIMVTVGQW